MQKLNKEERVHHPYSPSSLQAREGCAKFQQRGGPVHEMAIIGTKQHTSVDTEIDDETLPDFRAAAVAECIRHCEERAKAYPGGTVLKEVYLPVDDERIEYKFVEQVTNVDPDTGLESPGFRQKTIVFIGTTAGYIDFAVISATETEAELTDFKFGRNAVEDAENNVQGMGYALGLLKKYPKLERITVRFIMAHLDHVSECVFTAKEFPTMRLRITTIVRRSMQAAILDDDYSLATPNFSSCLFCGLIGRCPEVAKFVLRVGHKYQPLSIPENITPSSLFDPAQVGIGLKLASVVANWAEAYKRQANAKTIDSPGFIPEGYMLVETQKRAVKQARGLVELAKRFVRPENAGAVDACIDVSLGNLEDLISTDAERGSKEKTVDEFGKLALSAGYVELGEPFAYLKQKNKKTKKESK